MKIETLKQALAMIGITEHDFMNKCKEVFNQPRQDHGAITFNGETRWYWHGTRCKGGEEEFNRYESMKIGEIAK